MKYYATIIDGEINGKGQCPCSGDGVTCVEITEEVYNALDHYMWDGEAVVINPNYDEEQAEKERQRIAMLSCTKRDFALLLQEQGITYTQLKALIAQNEQAQLEWELCERLYRFNPLLDIMGAQLGVSSEILDYIFRKANGEIENVV